MNRKRRSAKERLLAIMLTLMLALGGMLPAGIMTADVVEAADSIQLVKVVDGTDTTINQTGGEVELVVGEPMTIKVSNAATGSSYQCKAAYADGNEVADGLVTIEPNDATTDPQWTITANKIIAASDEESKQVKITVSDVTESSSDKQDKATFLLTAKKKPVTTLSVKPDSGVDQKQLTITWSGFPEDARIITDSTSGNEVEFTVKDADGNKLMENESKTVTLTKSSGSETYEAVLSITKEAFFSKTITVTATYKGNDSYTEVTETKETNTFFKTLDLALTTTSETELTVEGTAKVPVDKKSVKDRDLAYDVTDGEGVITVDKDTGEITAMHSGTATITVTAAASEETGYAADTVGVTHTVKVSVKEINASDVEWSEDIDRVYDGKTEDTITGSRNGYTIELIAQTDGKASEENKTYTIADSSEENGKYYLKNEEQVAYVLTSDEVNKVKDEVTIKINQRPILLKTHNATIPYGCDVKAALLAEENRGEIVDEDDTGIIPDDKGVVTFDATKLKVKTKDGLAKYNIGTMTDSLIPIIDDKDDANSVSIEGEGKENYKLEILTGDENIGDLIITQEAPELGRLLENINFTLDEGQTMYPAVKEDIVSMGRLWISGGILRAEIDYNNKVFDEKYYSKVFHGGEDLTTTGFDATYVDTSDIVKKIYLQDGDNEDNRTVGKDFTISVDKAAPTVTFNGLMPLDNNNVDKLKTSLTFGLFQSTTYEQKVSISDVCSNESVEVEGSGIKSAEYYIWDLGTEKTDDDLTFKQVQAKAGELAKNPGISLFNGSIRVTESNNLIENVTKPNNYVFFVKVVDNVGNEAIYVSNGMVIEEEGPVIDLQMEYKEYYNGDIPYTVVVNDASDYKSGIDEVNITVTNKGDETKKDCEKFADVDEDGGATPKTHYSLAELSDFSSKTINKTVTGKSNNSNKVLLTITAVDNAGNAAVKIEKDLKIDITKPKIAVSYDNNTPTNDKFFKKNRVMTITFTERNLDKNQVTFDVKSGPDISGKKLHKNVSVSDLSDYGISTQWLSDSEKGKKEVYYTDERTNKLQLTFNKDNEYYIVPRCVDKAGNKNEGITYAEGTKAAKEFVIDKKKPAIEVSFDNNNALNEFYYDAPRTATITVDEHNFKASDVKTEITAEHQIERIAAPAISGWSNSGDIRTATVDFKTDGDYAFTVEYTDEAGNTAKVYTVDKFVIDQTEPEIEFFDIVDMSANNGTVAPGVRYMDVNYDANEVNITITGAKADHEMTGIDGNRSSDAHGESIKMADFAHEEDVDDVYTMNAEVRDKAGNAHSDSITFSVNRFGSNFIFSDETEVFLDKFYANKEQDLVVTEINVDSLEHRGISYGRDGDLVTLEEGKDYRVKASGDDVSWKSYQYTIPADNFQQEGRYSVTIDSRDRATNEVNNKIKEAEIEFVIDKTKPTVVLTGIEDGKRYTETSRNIGITVEDNVAMGRVDVYVDNSNKKSYAANTIKKEKGQLTYQMEGGSKYQRISAVAYDAAGNLAESDHCRVMISKNILFQIIRTPWLLITTLAALAAIGFLIFWLVKRRRNAGEQA